MTLFDLEYLAKEIARRIEPFVTLQKLSVETGMTQAAIRKACQRGELPYHRQGRKLVFFRSELNDKIRGER